MEQKLKLKDYISNARFMFRRSWELARGTWFFSIIGFILGTVQPFALLIMPKYILDELAGERRLDVTLRYVGIYAAVIIFFNLANLILNHFSTKEITKTSHYTSMDNSKKWLYMDYENFENGNVRDLESFATSEVDPRNFFDSTILESIKNVIQLAGYTYIIMSIHPIIVLFIIGVIGLDTLIAKRQNNFSYEYYVKHNRIARKFSYIMNNMIDFGVAKEVRINGASSWLRKKYDVEAENQMQLLAKNQRNHAPGDVLMMVIELVQTVVIYGYCAYLAINGNISVGSFSVFLGAVMAFAGAFLSFTGMFPRIMYSLRYVNDYKEYLKYTVHKGAKRETVSGDAPTHGKYDIEFVDVSFKYPNTDRFVLKHVNIKVKSGEKLSIVGYNGAGKSTFIKLLCRLYEPTEGKILVGGVDISTIKLQDYRELLSVVFQDYCLFFMSIRENIVLTRKYDDNALRDALEKSGLAECIAKLPNGIETDPNRAFNDDGTGLSGGEAQKLACARAYYKNAPIVILDEPTAALDPLAEVRLYERFDSIIKNKTSIYISHRLASVKFCDTIACFADGELVEHGTHKELMQKNGVYAEMFSKQAHYYVEDDPQNKEVTV